MRHSPPPLSPSLLHSSVPPLPSSLMGPSPLSSLASRGATPFHLPYSSSDGAMEIGRAQHDSESRSNERCDSSSLENQKFPGPFSSLIGPSPSPLSSLASRGDAPLHLPYSSSAGAMEIGRAQHDSKSSSNERCDSSSLEKQKFPGPFSSLMGPSSSPLSSLASRGDAPLHLPYSSSAGAMEIGRAQHDSESSSNERCDSSSLEKQKFPGPFSSLMGPSPSPLSSLASRGDAPLHLPYSSSAGAMEIGRAQHDSESSSNERRDLSCLEKQTFPGPFSGTIIAAFKYKNGLMGLCDSRNTALGKDHSHYTDDVEKFLVISKFSNIFFLLCGNQTKCQRMIKFATASIKALEPRSGCFNIPGGTGDAVPFDVAENIFRNAMKRVVKTIPPGVDAPFGGILIGQEAQTKAYTASALIHHSLDKFDHMYLESEGYLAKGSGAVYASVILEGYNKPDRTRPKFHHLDRGSCEEILQRIAHYTYTMKSSCGGIIRGFFFDNGTQMSGVPAYSFSPLDIWVKFRGTYFSEDQIILVLVKKDDTVYDSVEQMCQTKIWTNESVTTCRMTNMEDYIIYTMHAWDAPAAARVFKQLLDRSSSPQTTRKVGLEDIFKQVRHQLVKGMSFEGDIYIALCTEEALANLKHIKDIYS